jgi:hypothetical protein
MLGHVVPLWRLELDDGCVAHVEQRDGRVWWRLVQPGGRAEVLGRSADEQGARLRVVLAWRDATGLRGVPEAVREAALRGAA